MKTMIIGLGPEYNYDTNDHSIWTSDNTKYASNHGASLISRILLKYFSGDYIDDFEPIETYRKHYGLCVIAFATHVTNKRDVSRYAQFVKALGIKTVAFSLGIQDYSESSAMVGDIHSSMRELLDYVIDSSGFLGVRGPYTASVLIRNGYPAEQIVEVGCPTLFGNLKEDFQLRKPSTFHKPLVVYHRTMADLNKSILGEAPLLGQDFLDEVVFDSNIDEEHVIKRKELSEYKKLSNGNFALTQIKKQGIFVKTFQEWWDQIGQADFVIGARLHGCVAAILQGIPAVMLARDIRVKEIAGFFQIPCLMYDEVHDLTLKEIFDRADYSGFNAIYGLRYQHFIHLMHRLDITEYLSFEIPSPTASPLDDMQAHKNILYSELNRIEKKLESLQKEVGEVRSSNKKLQKKIKKLLQLPGASIFKRLLK